MSNPYQPSDFTDEKRSDDVSASQTGVGDERIDATSRRLTRLGQALLTAYFAVLFPVWLSLAWWVTMDGRPNLVAYLNSHHGHFSVLAGLFVFALAGESCLMFSPRRERFYLWVANLLRVLAGGGGFWMLLSDRASRFSPNFLPLYLAVMFALWMISESALLAFLRASAFRNSHRAAGHACEFAIALSATSAGCLSAWALLLPTRDAALLSGLLIGVTASWAAAISITIWVLRWFPVMPR